MANYVSCSATGVSKDKGERHHTEEAGFTEYLEESPAKMAELRI